MAQGEIASADRVYIGTDIALDTQPPVIAVPDFVGLPQVLLARIHDRSTPVRQADFTVELVTLLGGEPSFTTPGRWIGGQLWRIEPGIIPPEAGVELCATDRAGNRSCLPLVDEDAPDTDVDTDPITPPDPDETGGCGCNGGHPTGWTWMRAFSRR